MGPYIALSLTLLVKWSDDAHIHEALLLTNAWMFMYNWSLDLIIMLIICLIDFT